ncbi:BMP family ABC transporter substrate-binding protein [Litoribacillus peritrichatus]|uniref:BMP family ABC transporter substrate-binding protein n=1 Tax=Litoribacillus peritrichatus TaxID=718191 RepID=A0ABP7MYS6_9GAMM
MRFSILIMSVLLSCLSGATWAKPIKVAFVYVSPVGDVGWTRSHDQGRQYLEEVYGDRVETSFVDSVPEGKDSREVIEQLAKDGNDIIFTTSWGYMISSEKVAKNYPEVKIEHATGLRWGDNLSAYSTRAYQARYLSGVVAGRMTKSNRIGYVAAHPIPEVIRGINAFTLGVRSVNPAAEVAVEWTKKWYAPQVEADITNKLIDDGADLITHHTDTSEPVKVAESRGVYAIGFHTDMSKYGPKTHLLSVTHHWGRIYEQRIAALENGAWTAQDFWPGLKEGTSELSSVSSAIPKAVMRQVDQIKNEIVEGQLRIFTGPIKNHQGRRKVRKDKVLDDSDLARMNWFVEGVVGSI